VETIIQMLDDEAGWAAYDDLTVLAIDDAWVRYNADLEAAPPLRKEAVGRAAQSRN